MPDKFFGSRIVRFSFLKTQKSHSDCDIWYPRVYFFIYKRWVIRWGRSLWKEVAGCCCSRGPHEPSISGVRLDRSQADKEVKKCTGSLQLWRHYWEKGWDRQTLEVAEIVSAELAASQKHSVVLRENLKQGNSEKTKIFVPDLS